MSPPKDELVKYAWKLKNRGDSYKYIYLSLKNKTQDEALIREVIDTVNKEEEIRATESATFVPNPDVLDSEREQIRLNEEARRQKAEDELEHVLAKQQSFMRSILFGFMASLAMAIIWAIISLTTGSDPPLMALVVGFVVGIVVLYFGRGVSIQFKILAAGLAFFGCLLGKVLSVIGMLSIVNGTTFSETFMEVNLAVLFEKMLLSSSVWDLIVYGLSAWLASYFAVFKSGAILNRLKSQ